MLPRLLTRSVCEPHPRCLTREGINPDTSSSARDRGSLCQKCCRRAFVRVFFPGEGNGRPSEAVALLLYICTGVCTHTREPVVEGW